MGERNVRVRLDATPASCGDLVMFEGTFATGTKNADSLFFKLPY